MVMLAANLTWDLQGNLTSDGSKTYEWDIRGRLAKVKEGEPTLAEFRYDSYGRRVMKISPLESKAYDYYYDGWRVIEEYLAGSVTARNVWGLYLDETVVRTSTTDGKDYYPCLNPIYSPLRIYDGNASLVARVRYTPYGKPTLVDGAGSPVGALLYYLFTGQRLDDGTGLAYYKNRYYSHELGRFVSRDSLADLLLNGNSEPAFAYASTNFVPVLIPQLTGHGLTESVSSRLGSDFRYYRAYTYCHSTPTTCIDPSGFIEWCPEGVGIEVVDDCTPLAEYCLEEKAGGTYNVPTGGSVGGFAGQIYRVKALVSCTFRQRYCCPQGKYWGPTYTVTHKTDHVVATTQLWTREPSQVVPPASALVRAQSIAEGWDCGSLASKGGAAPGGGGGCTAGTSNSGSSGEPGFWISVFLLLLSAKALRGRRSRKEEVGRG